MATKAEALEVLEVFSDASYEHVLKLLEQHDSNVQDVLSDMLENKYPRDEGGKATRNGGTATTQNGTDEGTLVGQSTSTIQFHHSKPSIAKTVTRQHEMNCRYDFMTTSSFQPSSCYRIEVPTQLRWEFPFLTKAGCDAILAKWDFHYAVCHDKILSALKEGAFSAMTKRKAEDSVPLHEQIHAVLRGEKSPCRDQIKLMNTLVCTRTTRPAWNILARAKKPRQPIIIDDVLREEVEYVAAKLVDWLVKEEEQRSRDSKDEFARGTGTGVECPCCCDCYHIDNMVSCRQGHLFCAGCLKSYAENHIFGSANLGFDGATKRPSVDLRCFHADGCRSGFCRSTLEKALSKVTMEKYDEMLLQISVDVAGVSDLCTCPKCGYRAALPASEKLFRCPLEGCRYESCRHCGEPPHIPLRCSEVEKERETKGRTTVEEAISAAKIRNCPKCNRGFVKSDGCNKIKCGCGALVCYVCREEIKDYTHFCQRPHCKHKNCNMCPLWTSTDEDARALREAGAEAAAQVLEQSSSGQGELKVDLDSILRDPSAVM